MRTAILLLAAATLYAQESPKGVNLYSAEKERALGAQLAKEYRIHSDPLNSPRALAWIQNLVSRLAGPDNRIAYTLELTKDDPNELHEPVALPGGFIFVPAALILAAQNEDEFAGMVAHSIAHITVRHGTRSASAQQAGNFASIPLISIGGWSGSGTPRTGMAIPRGFVQSHRESELEADRMAVAMMSAAGYDPEALARYIEREQRPDPAQPNPYSPLPERAARLAAIHALVTPQNYPPHREFAEIEDEIRRALAR
jgi:beta-barrel assembly-enhancing protease